MERLSGALNDHKGDMSLRELARSLGVSTTTVEAWLKGWRRPGWEHIEALSAFLEEDRLEVVTWILDDVASKKGLSEAPIIHGLSSGRRRPKDSRPPGRPLPLPA